MDMILASSTSNEDLQTPSRCNSITMSISKLQAFPSAVVNRKLTEEDKDPQVEKKMDDLPPEVLTMILKLATRDKNRNKMLNYRLINSQWKDIMNSLIEKSIFSGDFPVFPEMNVVGDDGDESTRLFPASENPFPFNSLLLSGTTSSADFDSHPERYQMPMSVETFGLRIGGRLTSFSLHKLRTPIETLAGLLGFMPCLKRLSLFDVEEENFIIRPNSMFPTAPWLPNLSTLEVKPNPRFGVWGDDKINVYMWLIVSYADQLISLSMKTGERFRPLLKNHQYFDDQNSASVDNGERFPIASTTDAAFGNLKQLKICCPTRYFLRQSEITTLKQLSVRGMDGKFFVDLRDLIRFAERSGATLETLCLDVFWFELVPSVQDYTHQVGQLEPEVLLPMLKTLAIHYPSKDLHERILSEELLVKFPALEVLQLLRYWPSYLDYEISSVRDENERQDEAAPLRNENERQSEIAVLKQQLTSHRNHHSNLQDARVVRLALAPLPHGEAHEFAELPPENPAIEEIVRAAAMASVQNEMTRIFTRLLELGERKETIIAELLIQRRGFWNGCPNLKVLSVSSEEIPDGDICLVRRPSED